MSGLLQEVVGNSQWKVKVLKSPILQVNPFSNNVILWVCLLPGQVLSFNQSRETSKTVESEFNQSQTASGGSVTESEHDGQDDFHKLYRKLPITLMGNQRVSIVNWHTFAYILLKAVSRRSGWTGSKGKPHSSWSQVRWYICLETSRSSGWSWNRS